MKKQFLFFAVAALALASCSSENDVVQTPDVQQTADDGVVNFDVYVGRGLSRGGVNGPVTTETLKEYSNDHCKAGFGVFGYYTDGEPYSAITKPNFFYNQQVKYESGNWTYTPLKYWPNEFGGDAASDQVDRVTLFAYLPYVEVDPLTGVTKAADVSGISDPDEKNKKKNQTDPTSNITGMTRNTSTGDPFIKYVATMDPTNSVDLCYGVAAEDFTSSNSSINKNEIGKGKPYIDVKKPGTDANSKIKFDFKHATAQLKVTIDADVKDLTTGSTNIQTAYTRIWVRSVTFTGITQKGSLNLNSNAGSPEWYDLNGNSKITTGSLTVYDGRKDGKEANDAASNESPATLNTNIVQTEQYTIDDNTNTISKPDATGVTETRVDLFGNALGAPVFVIPTKEKMRVTIVYDVETYDPNLPYFLSDGKTPGSSIQNTIYKDIETFKEIEAGYCYTLNLHLGMRTVDFDAQVTPWQEYGGDVDLPSNLQTFAAKQGGNTGTISLPADLTPDSNDDGEFVFAVSGLKVNATPNVPATITLNGATITVTATPVNSAGITKVTLSGIKENKSVTKQTAQFTVADGDGKSVTLTVNQAAGPLGLSINGVASNYVALAIATTTTWDDAITDYSKQMKVWRNGQPMEIITTSTTPTATQAKFDKNLNRIYFSSIFVAGDVITVWIQAGNAIEESVTANIGSISFGEIAIYRPKSEGTYTYPCTLIGQGDVEYTPASGSSIANVDNNGKITFAGYGKETITATVTPKSGYYFIGGTNATYDIYIADTQFSAGGTYTYDKGNVSATASSYNIVISGLTTNGAVTVEKTAGTLDGTTPCSIKAGTDAGGSGNADEADANGFAVVSFKTEDNNSGDAREIKLTVTDSSSSKTMTITINQLGS